MVADVFSTKPLSADSDHKYTCTGNEDDGSIGVEGMSTTKLPYQSELMVQSLLMLALNQ